MIDYNTGMENTLFLQIPVSFGETQAEYLLAMCLLSVENLEN